MTPMAVYVMSGDSTVLLIVHNNDDAIILRERGFHFPRLISHCEWDGSVVIDELLEDKPWVQGESQL